MNLDKDGNKKINLIFDITIVLSAIASILPFIAPELYSFKVEPVFILLLALYVKNVNPKNLRKIFLDIPEERVFIQTNEENLFGITHLSEVTKETLKKEYLSLSKKHHPDFGGTTIDMQKVNSAYEKLLKKYNL